MIGSEMNTLVLGLGNPDIHLSAMRLKQGLHSAPALF